jgi:hypothetical protein
VGVLGGVDVGMVPIYSGSWSGDEGTRVFSL